MILTKKYPWRRYWAKWIDYYIWGCIVSFILEEALILPAQLFDILIIVTWIAIEPFFISFLGTTPGKWILGIRVLRINGGKLSLSEAFFRSSQVWSKGMACGFPIFYLFTMAKSRTILLKEGTTIWDVPNGNQTIISKLSGFRIGIFVCVLASFSYMLYKDELNNNSLLHFEQLVKKYPEKRTEILANYLTQVSEILDNKFSLEHFSDENNPEKKYR